MQEEDLDVSVKVIVVGHGGVGKSSMIRRFCTGDFTDEYKKTYPIGVDFLEKEQYIPSLAENVRLMLWDTAGQEEFDTLTRSYYRGAGGAVLVFSITDRDSFRDIGRWKAKVDEECGPIEVVLVMNKTDLVAQATVTRAEAEDLACKLELPLFQTCVKDNINVNEVFEHLASAYVKRPKEPTPSPGSQPVGVPTRPIGTVTIQRPLKQRTKRKGKCFF